MGKVLPGTMITTRSTITQIAKHTRIFISFHHICLRTRLAPRRKPWADTARLSVLSWRESRRSPRWETLLMFSRITPTVSSICYKKSHVSFPCCHKCLSRPPLSGDERSTWHRATSIYGNGNACTPLIPSRRPSTEERRRKLTACNAAVRWLPFCCAEAPPAAPLPPAGI